MAALRRALTLMLARLRDINLSQRMALLLGGALVAISLIWLVQWAAAPEMVVLLDQDLGADELALVRSGLDLLGEPCEVRGNRVYVRAMANRQALIAQLMQQDKLPANTSTAFANLIQQSDPWISMEESNRRWTFALQQTLEQVLRQFNGVKSANVFLNLTALKKSFSRTEPPSSASITLAMRHGAEVPHALALAAARLVSGAVSGLPVHNVEVVDASSGRVAVDWGEEQDPAAALDRKLAHAELRCAERIRRIIPDAKALVSVLVELNSTTSNVQTETPTKGQEVSVKTTSEKTTRGRSTEPPGVQPNVSLAAGGGALEESQEKDTSEAETKVGVERKVTATPAGDIEKVTAAISLSQSYLEAVFQRTTGGGAPNEQQVEEVFQRERARLMAQVVQLVRPQAEENVAISRYYDAVSEPAQAGAPTTVEDALHLVRSYGPQSALGLLALVSLAFMIRMARKSDTSEVFGLELGLPDEAIEAAKLAAADVSTLVSSPTYAAVNRRPGQRARSERGAGATATPAPGEEAAGPVEQAAVTEGLLVAQEVDPRTVQTRKMVEQIAQMVESNPETVAALVEHWVQRAEQYHDEVN